MFLVNKKLFAGIVFFGIAAGMINFFDPVLLAGLIFCVFLGSVAILVLFYLNKKEDKKLIYIFLSVFILYIAIVLFLHYTNFQPFSGGDGDYQKYDYNARVIAESFRSGDFSLKNKISYTGRPILEWDNYYPLFIALIYLFILPSMLLGQLFNAWLVALSVVAIYLLVLEIGGSKKGAVITSVIVAFYPSLAFYGSLLLKDAIAIFFAMFGLLFAVKIANSFKWRQFLIFYFLLACLVHFRFYVGYALATSFALSWFLFCKLPWPKKAAHFLIIFLLFGFLPLFASQDIFAYRTILLFLNRQTVSMYRETAYLNDIQSQPINDIQSQPINDIQSQQENPNIILNPEKLEPSKKDINPSASFLLKINFENPLSFLYTFAKSFVFTFLGPFFWRLKNLRQYLTIMETIPWYFLIFFIGRGLFLNIKQKYKKFLPLLIFSFILIGISSFYISNFGAITRIRIPAFLSLLCLCSFGFEKMSPPKEWFKKLMRQ